MRLKTFLRIVGEYGACNLGVNPFHKKRQLKLSIEFRMRTSKQDCQLHVAFSRNNGQRLETNEACRNEYHAF